MWLGHSIEHLVCIGGELEHHQALSPSARKNRAVCFALTRGGIYRHLIGPGSWHEPGLKGSLWSRVKPPTGTNGLAQWRGGEFSPTLLAKREPHLFIRCGALELSSSSLKQAFGPNSAICACGPTGPPAGLNPGPWLGF